MKAGIPAAEDASRTHSRPSPQGRSSRSRSPEEQRLSTLAPGIYSEFSRLFGAIIALTALLVIGMGLVMIYLPHSSADTLDKAVMLRMMQLAFGNFFGGVCVYLGVILCWFSIREQVRASAELDNRDRPLRAAIETTSPGVILMLAGAGLIAVAMFSDIEISDQRKPPPGDTGSVGVLFRVPLTEDEKEQMHPPKADRFPWTTILISGGSILAGLAAGFVLGTRKRPRLDSPSPPEQTASAPEPLET